MAANAIVLQIVRLVDESPQPGTVEGEFVDAAGRRHRLIDKVPIFTAEKLDRLSIYPQPGQAGCEVLECWTDASGRSLARITLARPDAIEGTDGSTEFVVSVAQLVDAITP